MSRKEKQTRTQELETLVVLAAFLLVLDLIIIDRQALLYAALALLLIGLFVKPLAQIITKGWLLFAEKIGTFNSKLILSIVFYLFLTPLAFLFRIFTKNPLMIKREATESFYTVRNHTFEAVDLEKMW